MKLEEAIKIFRVFSDRTRLKIFLMLLDSDLCVGELMTVLQIEQSLISHQLKIMRQVGLVEGRKSGRWVFYRIPEACRKELEPLFRNWLKDELIAGGRWIKAVKEKKVCSLSLAERRRLGQALGLEAGTAVKRRKRVKKLTD